MKRQPTERVHHIEEAVMNPKKFYQQEAEAAAFHHDALDLIRRMKKHLNNGIGAQKISEEASEFVAKHQNTEAA